MTTFDENIEQIMQLRSLTELTGVLHEAQVLQLKMWPYIHFKKIKSHTINIDFEKKAIKYDLVGEKDKNDSQFLLTQDIKLLLGEFWDVKYSWERGPIRSSKRKGKGSLSKLGKEP